MNPCLVRVLFVSTDYQQYYCSFSVYFVIFAKQMIYVSIKMSRLDYMLLVVSKTEKIYIIKEEKTPVYINTFNYRTKPGTWKHIVIKVFSGTIDGVLEKYFLSYQTLTNQRKDWWGLFPIVNFTLFFISAN